MGRGRAKAKQTKVARQLKYNAPEMDLASLQEELHSQSAGSSDPYSDKYPELDYNDWADKWAEDED